MFRTIILAACGLAVACAGPSMTTMNKPMSSTIPVAPPRVSHVLTIFAVEDISRTAAFYRQAFGWHQTVDVPVYVEFQMSNGTRLGLYKRTGYAINIGVEPERVPPGRIAATELYFYSDKLEASIQQLESAGARMLSALASRDWGDEAAYYADPDGNVLVLARPLPRERSGPKSPAD